MKFLKLSMSAIALLALFSMPGCKGKEEVSKQQGGFKEIDIPCSGPKFRSDKDFFRADNSAISQRAGWYAAATAAAVTATAAAAVVVAAATPLTTTAVASHLQ